MLKTPFTHEYRTLIDGLVARREANGFSQRDLAERLAAPQSMIAKIEIGERRIDMVEYIIIAQVLGASPQEIGAEVAAVATLSTRISLA